MTARVLAIPARKETLPSGQLEQEAVHLRRLLETQPSCLMRVAIDGQLLAANEAALALFGAKELSDVVGHILAERIAATQAADWQNFAGRVWDEGPASFECGLTTVSGLPKTVLFQAVPLRGHPDEVRSILLTARDLSTSRRLEVGLEHREAVANAQDLGPELAQARAELEVLRAQRGRAETSLAEHEATQQRLAAEHASEVARLTQTLAEHHQLISLLTGRADSARAEQQRVAALLQDRDAEYERLVAQRTAEQARLQQAITDEHDRAQTLDRHSSELGALRGQLASAAAEAAELKTSLERGEAEYRQLVAAQEAEGARLEQATAAERERAQGLERQAKQLAGERETLEAALAAAVAESADLRTLLESRGTEYKQLLTAQAAERAQLEQAVAAERERAQALEGQAKQLAGERETFEAALAAAVATNADLRTLLESRGTEYTQLLTAQAAERAQLEQAVASERERAESLERQARLFADVQTELQSELEAVTADTTDLKALVQQQQDALKDLRGKLVSAAGERQRLDAILKQRDAADQRSAAEYAAERASADRALQENARQRAEVVKLLADQKLDLQIVMESLRDVEPLAAAGRLAFEINGELQTSLAQIEQRAARLIERCSLEAIDRTEIEQLRRETARAASLLRQLVRPNTKACGGVSDGD